MPEISLCVHPPVDRSLTSYESSEDPLYSKTHSAALKALEEASSACADANGSLPNITLPTEEANETSRVALAALDESVAIRENFINALQKLIALVFAQLSRISENDSKRTEELQRKYQLFTEESANLLRKNGNAGPLIAIAGFVTLLASSFGTGNKEIQELGKFVSGQIPQVAGMFTAEYSAQGKQKDNYASLKLQEYIEKAGKKQSEGNAKQDYIKIIEAAEEALKRASQAH